MVGRRLIGGIAFLLLGLPAANAAGTTPRAGGHGWAANATQWAGDVGAIYRYSCPRYGTVGQIWGTGVYTTDSSVCTAAVHDGQILLSNGGDVLIKIEPGRSSYHGTNHDGMTSLAYGSWDSSYVFVGTPKLPSTNVGYGGAGWGAELLGLNASVGQRYMFVCPAHGTFGTIWGTTEYTDDSAVCTAAVHAGRLQQAAGGVVLVQVIAGARSYRGTTQNGVTSNGYGKNGTEPSYIFVSGGVQMADQWHSTI